MHRACSALSTSAPGDSSFTWPKGPPLAHPRLQSCHSKGPPSTSLSSPSQGSPNPPLSSWTSGDDNPPLVPRKAASPAGNFPQSPGSAPSVSYNQQHQTSLHHLSCTVAKAHQVCHSPSCQEGPGSSGRTLRPRSEATAFITGSAWVHKRQGHLALLTLEGSQAPPH